MDNPEKKQSNLVFGMPKGKFPSWQQWKYLGAVLNFREKWILDVCWGVVILAVMSIGVYAYFRETVNVPKAGEKYTEGLVGYPERINPILAQTNDVDMDLVSLVYSGLFKYNTKQELVPELVSNYEISEDLKTYTFYMRRDVKWQDDESLTADDVLFTINAIQDPNFQSPLEQSMRGVQAEKIDDYTLRLVLSEPFSPFLSTLTFGILPRHIWYDIYKISPQNVFLTEYNLKPIGSGPYMFDSLIKDKAGNIKSYKFIPSPNYYGKKPYISEINLVFYADVYAATDDLTRKKIDGLFAVPRDMKSSVLKKNKDLKVYNTKLPQYTALFFNQDLSKKVLAKDEVREALVWGVDRQKIINDIFGGEAQAVYTPILPGYLGHNADVEKYGLDIEKGKQILEDAGWKVLEGNPYRQKDGQILEFTIFTVDQPEYTQVIDILKTNWEQMGFKINVSLFSAQDIQEQVIKGRNYEALLFGEIMGIDPDPYAFWHSSQQEHPGLALAIFYQKDIDKLLEDARKTIDVEQRRLNYFHFQNVLAEEIPAIFLYSPTYIYMVNKDVQGVSVQDIPLPSARFLDIVNWYIKTSRIRKK